MNSIDTAVVICVLAFFLFLGVTVHSCNDRVKECYKYTRSEKCPQ